MRRILIACCLGLLMVGAGPLAEESEAPSGADVFAQAPANISETAPPIFHSTTAILDGCMGDIYDQFGQGGGLQCTAEDVKIANVQNIVVTDDGCAFVGDTVTFDAELEVLLGAQARHDIGLFLGTEGNALNGTCLIDILPIPQLCSGVEDPYIGCTGPGTGNYTDLDGTGDDQDKIGACSGDNAQPCLTDADCSGVGGVCEQLGPGIQDICGDIDDDPNPIFTTVTDLTIVCADTNGDGYADLPNCMSWRQPGANELCLGPLYAFPGAPSKCKCGTTELFEIPVPKTITVVKELIPDTDPGLFDLEIDGTPYVTNVGDGGTTGPVAVDPGAHTAGEIGGDATGLDGYMTSIECIDNVGRCVGDPTVHCLTDFACDIADNGKADGTDTCNMTPVLVASCTDCTVIDVDVPEAQSDIVCTITNTEKCSLLDCDDGVECTTDSCEVVGGVATCVNTTDDTVCDDGLYCNGIETCDPELGCQAGAAVDCDDGVACTVDSCNEDTDSCDNSPDDTVCDDGLYCNGVEICDPELGCQAGAPIDCNDGVACTIDVCNEATDSCDSTPDDTVCNDGLYCNGVEFCDPALDCQAGAPVDCDDGVACTIDTCNETTDSCDNSADDTACDDGLYCNGIETCDPELGCQAGAPVNCADGVSCTIDACNEATDSCDNVPTDAICDDGVFCNGAEYCDPALDCQAGTPVVCNDGVVCTDDYCDEALDQCAFVPNDGSCDDGDVCTDDACLPDDGFAGPDGCVHTPLPDGDSDGVCDDLDICPGGDDNQDSDGDGIPDYCDIECDPRTQGFWHRQCMGIDVDHSDGGDGIEPGRNGFGPPRVNEPDFHDECVLGYCELGGEMCETDSDCQKLSTYTCAETTLSNLLSTYAEANTCDAMDAEPPSDPCMRATKQLTALVLNTCSDRLSDDGCDIDYSGTECSIVIPDMDSDGVYDEIVDDLVAYLDQVITNGDDRECRQAASCAAEVNEGNAVTNNTGAGASAASETLDDSGDSGDAPANLRVTPSRLDGQTDRAIQRPGTGTRSTRERSR